MKIFIKVIKFQVQSVIKEALIATNYREIKHYPQLTIKHIMTHTSGYKLADDWVNTIRFKNEGKYTASTVYFQGGTKLRYSDIRLLVLLLKQLNKSPFKNYFTDYIAIKMEMENATYLLPSMKIKVAIADGLQTQMIDYADFQSKLSSQQKQDYIVCQHSHQLLLFILRYLMEQ